MADTVYDAILGAGNNLRQVMAARFAAGNSILPGRVSAGVDPSELYVDGAEPRFSLDTVDLAGALALVDIASGLAVASDTITIPWAKRSSGGSFAGTLAHFTLSATDGLFWWESLTASQNGGHARGTIAGVPLSSDGTTAPVSANVNQTLAAQAFSASHALGPVTIGGAAVTGVQQVTVNPGIEVLTERTDGAVFPTAIYLVQRNPSIDVQFIDADKLNTYGPLFASFAAAVVYFKHRAAGGTYVSGATTSHISLTFGDGIADVQDLSGQEQQTAPNTIRLVGESLTAAVNATLP